MAQTTFPYNPLLERMEYTGQELSLVFKKKDGLQKRTYAEVPQHVAYALLYRKTGSEVMSYFTTYIKKQYKVIEVKPAKK